MWALKKVILRNEEFKEKEYHKMEAEGCPYTNIIMAFKVLKAAKLNKMDGKLVLTGVEYDKGKKR